MIMQLTIFLMYLTRELHAVTVRQAVSCVNDSDCSPSNISSTGIKCINGTCVCSGSCFTLNRTSSRCTFSTCGSYNNSICTPIDPKSQLTAFLLTFFVLPTGAANFYIGQYGLGMYVSMRCRSMCTSVAGSIKCIVQVNVQFIIPNLLQVVHSWRWLCSVVLLAAYVLALKVAKIAWCFTYKSNKRKVSYAHAHEKSSPALGSYIIQSSGHHFLPSLQY